MEKPVVLYHGSSNREISEFKPRTEKVRDPLEGPRVFATNDKRMASVFIAGTDDSWANSGMYNEIPYLVISDRDRFVKLDEGGTIYHLPSDSFETDPNKGLGEIEWTSGESVEPLHREEHHTALEAMLEHGVQVYFVDPATYQAWRTASDHGLSILKSLVSENERKGINPIPFE
ncbi:MAG: hypothetical protein AAB737_03805 [Patescibacteria group bacterium]